MVMSTIWGAAEVADEAAREEDTNSYGGSFSDWQAQNQPDQSDPVAMANQEAPAPSYTASPNEVAQEAAYGDVPDQAYSGLQSWQPPPQTPTPGSYGNDYAFGGAADETASDPIQQALDAYKLAMTFYRPDYLQAMNQGGAGGWNPYQEANAPEPDTSSQDYSPDAIAEIQRNRLETFKNQFSLNGPDAALNYMHQQGQAVGGGMSAGDFEKQTRIAELPNWITNPVKKGVSLTANEMLGNLPGGPVWAARQGLSRLGLNTPNPGDVVADLAVPTNVRDTALLAAPFLGKGLDAVADLAVPTNVRDTALLAAPFLGQGLDAVQIASRAARPALEEAGARLAPVGRDLITGGEFGGIRGIRRMENLGEAGGFRMSDEELYARITDAEKKAYSLEARAERLALDQGWDDPTVQRLQAQGALYDEDLNRLSDEAAKRPSYRALIEEKMRASGQTPYQSMYSNLPKKAESQFGPAGRPPFGEEPVPAFGDLPPKSPTPFSSANVPPPPEGPVEKLTAAIKAAKPLPAESESLRSAVRSQRAAAAYGAIQGEGTAGERLAASRQALLRPGEMPRAAFDAPATHFTPDEIDQLRQKIIDADLQPYQWTATNDALNKVLTGQLNMLQPAELLKLERVFGKELVSELQKANPGSFMAALVDAAGTPRNILASMDMSAPGRQGILLGPGHIKEWASAFKSQAQAYFSENAAKAIDDVIHASPYAELKEQSKLYLAPLDTAVLSAREEAILSRWVNDVPGVRNSQRAYTTALNKLRSDVFDTYAAKWDAQGTLTDERAKSLADYINAATGRGNLGSFSSAASEISVPFFAPRLLVSRFEVPVQLFHPGTDNAVRLLIARDLASFIATGSTVVGLGVLAGATTQLDPRSSDFAKIRVGNQRIDPWGGYQQLVRYATQAVTGQRKTGTGYVQDQSFGDTLWNFLRSKMSPSAGAVTSAISGEDMIGNSFYDSFNKLPSDRQSFWWNTFVPLFMQDVRDGLAEEGLKGGALGSLSFFGVGTQAYKSQGMTAIKENQPSLYEAINDYYQAYDDGFRIARQDAPEGSIIKDYATLNDFEKHVYEVYKADGVPSAEWDSRLAKLEKSYGITDLIRNAKMRAVRTDPGLLDYLEQNAGDAKLRGEDRQGPPKWLRDYATSLKDGK